MHQMDQVVGICIAVHSVQATCCTARQALLVFILYLINDDQVLQKMVLRQLKLAVVDAFTKVAVRIIADGDP
jgi:hypothetical protein